MSIDYSKLEKRKVEEIEHSKKRRTILQGFERQVDSNEDENLNLENLVKDKKEFDYHFSNMKYYSITRSSEQFKENWLKNEKTLLQLLRNTFSLNLNSQFLKYD